MWVGYCFGSQNQIYSYIYGSKSVLLYKVLLIQQNKILPNIQINIIKLTTRKLIYFKQYNSQWTFQVFVQLLVNFSCNYPSELDVLKLFMVRHFGKCLNLGDLHKMLIMNFFLFHCFIYLFDNFQSDSISGMLVIFDNLLIFLYNLKIKLLIAVTI